jgi:hypothetical protein
MAISNADKAKLNAMCPVASLVALGTILQDLQKAQGKHTVTSAEATAGTVSIDAGRAVSGFVVTLIRGGNEANGAAISGVENALVVATNGSTYVLTEGDIINYIVF